MAVDQGWVAITSGCRYVVKVEELRPRNFNITDIVIGLAAVVELMRFSKITSILGDLNRI
jgi:hypothetical protein